MNRSETNRIIATKHGFAIPGKVHPIYRAYNRIKNDCYNRRSKDFHKYGAKGVKMCDEWLNDFKSFKNWCLVNGWVKGLTIDRFPNKFGNYEPNNCRWTNYTLQNRNRDFNINITAFGETKCLQEWYYDLRCYVTAKTIKDRMSRGWDAESAISLKSASAKRRSPKVTEWVKKDKKAA